ncbi:hypothetical protein AB0G96_28310, partial [Streptomyces mobaraensis]
IAIQEAADHYRALAQTNPDAYLPDLATSLNNLSIQLGEVGRREEGLTAIQEAVRIRRALAETKYPELLEAALQHSLEVTAWLESLPH